jgi:GNAT superfamily N-acetyltransferase
MTAVRPPVAVSLRPSTEADGPLLREVYAATRAEELDQVSWAPGQREAFLDMQFVLQDGEFRRHFADGDFSVVEVDGVAAGRLYVGRLPGELRIIDVALLPAFRGLGVGTLLLTGVQAQAESEGRRVALQVETRSPARRLYERLGFAVTGQVGVRLLMEWAA